MYIRPLACNALWLAENPPPSAGRWSTYVNPESALYAVYGYTREEYSIARLMGYRVGRSAVWNGTRVASGGQCPNHMRSHGDKYADRDAVIIDRGLYELSEPYRVLIDEYVSET